MSAFRESARRGIGLSVALMSALSPLAAQNCPYYMTPVPSVLLSDGSNTIAMEIFGGTSATGVRWQLPAGTPLVVRGSTPCPTQPLELDLKDDGTQGDRIAGDRLFTIDAIRYRTAAEGQCNAGTLFQAREPDGFFSMRAGIFTVATPSGPVVLDSTPNFITFHVMAPENLRLRDEVTPVNATRQESPYIVNVRDDALTLERGMSNLIPSNGITNISAVATLTSFLPDSYDFRNIVSTTQTMCSVGITGMHLNARNRATGIGNPGRDLFAEMQTGANLLGANMIAYHGVPVVSVHYHETFHQWGAYLPTSLGLSNQTGHWVPNSSVAGSLGGCAWQDNGNGTFTLQGNTRPTRDNGDLELYLAGFIPLEQVNPLRIAGAPINVCTAGAAVPGPIQTVTANDIVAAVGRRTPGPDTAQKNFKQATVVTSAGRLLTPLEMTFYGRIAQTWEGYTVETTAEPPVAWPSYTRGLSTLNLKLDSYTGPFLRAAGVVHGASAAGGRITVGQVVVLYGEKLGPAALAGLELDAAGRVATQVAGMRVFFDEFPAPVIYSSANQVSVVVPYGIVNRRMVSVQAEYQGRKSNTIALPVSFSNPAIFSQNLTGKGPGAILNQDNTLNTAANPAPQGSIIQVYGTGEGVTFPTGVDGQVNGARPPQPTLGVTATIDGQNAVIAYRGGAPFAITGLLQVNMTVPTGIRSGAVPIQIRVGTVASPADVTVFVR
jgi:uncharacterized protein (TIGR03437 family)